MAQTAQLVHELATGVVDNTGAVVASGVATFYQPGTLSALVTGVWSDAQASTPLSNPVTLSAGGTATVYLTVPARMILKKSDLVTTVLDVNANPQLAGAVYIKNANINAGAETTLDAYLSSVGQASAYLESSGATTRSVASRLQDQEVSLKDFGAIGDGVQDDTVVIQAAFDHCGATGKDLLVPAATFLISSAISLSNYSKKFNIRGVGAKSSIFKQSNASASCLSFSYSGSTDWGGEVRSIGITCSTISTGAAVNVNNTNNLTLRDVEIALFRNGVSASTSTGLICDHLSILSTDGNALALGVVTGSGARLERCVLTGSSSNGTAVTLGADSHASELTISGWSTGVTSSSTGVRVRGGKVSSCATGVTLSGDNSTISDFYASGVTGTSITLSGQYGRASSCQLVALPSSATGLNVFGAYGAVSSCVVNASSSTSTTGISLAAAGGEAHGCTITGCATGISVGAVADCRVFGNNCVSNTADISINGSATTYSVFGNKETSNRAQTLHTTGRLVGGSVSASITTTSAFTPTVGTGGAASHNVVQIAPGASNITVTINATSTTGLVVGDLLWLSLIRMDSGAGTCTLSWNAQYIGPAGAMVNIIGALPASTTTGIANVLFYWNGSSWVCAQCSQSRND